MVGSTVSDVSMKEYTGYEAVTEIIGRRMAGEADRKAIKKPDITGTDEIALKKVHRNSVTVITYYLGDRVEVLGVIGGREKQTVKDFLSEIPGRLRNSIRVVCCDMYEGYISAVKEVPGKKGSVVADLFQRIFNDIEGYSLFGCRG